MRKVVNISLPEQLHNEVERAVKNGHYSSKSEFFRDLLRQWQAGKNASPNDSFDAKGMLSAVREHAKETGPSDLSEKHDHYLYEADTDS